MDLMKKIMASPDDSSSEDSFEQQRVQRKPRSKSNGISRKKRAPPPPPPPSPPPPPQNDEVDLLRKEIEELKFYQELEQTEYNEMKEKMRTYEKQMKEMEAKKEKQPPRQSTAETRRSEKSGKSGISGKSGKSSKSGKSERSLRKIDEDSELLDLSNIDTIELITSSAAKNSKKGRKGSGKDNILHKKLMKRDSQIQELKTKLEEKDLSSKESSGKLKALATEYERRLFLMEKLKDEEIDDVQDHYKQIMESLAKQIQRIGKRHNEEVEKNIDLRAMMKEMATDMSKREKELERQLNLQQASMKKNDLKLGKAESKLERTGSKYSSIKNELDEALQSNRNYSMRVKQLEQRYDKDIKELKEKAESEVNEMQLNLEAEIESLTGKLVDMEKLFDEEAAEHDKTMNKLAEVEKALETKGELENNQGMKRLQDEIRELTEERNYLRKDLEATTSKLQKIDFELKLITDDKSVKNRSLKKKSDEIQAMQKKVLKMKDSHAKELKMKDIDFVKAKKKWSLSEQKLQGEIEDLKKVLERFEELQETDSGNLIIEGAAEYRNKCEFQKKLIEQLKSDKASLQLKIANLKGKQKTETMELEKELTRTRRLLTASNYERTLDRKMGTQHRIEMTRSQELNDERREEVEAQSEVDDEEPLLQTISTQFDMNESHHHVSVIDEKSSAEKDGEKVQDRRTSTLESPSASSEESTVLVANAKPNKYVEQPKGGKGGLSTQKSYRNYVRKRQFIRRKPVKANSE